MHCSINELCTVQGNQNPSASSFTRQSKRIAGRAELVTDPPCCYYFKDAAPAPPDCQWCGELVLEQLSGLHALRMA